MTSPSEMATVDDVLRSALDSIVKEERSEGTSLGDLAKKMVGNGKKEVFYTWWAFEKEDDVGELNKKGSYPHMPGKEARYEYREPGTKDRKVILENKKPEGSVKGVFLGVNGMAKLDKEFEIKFPGDLNHDKDAYPIIALGAAFPREEQLKRSAEQKLRTINTEDLAWKWDFVKVGNNPGRRTVNVTPREVITIRPEVRPQNHPNPLEPSFGSHIIRQHRRGVNNNEIDQEFRWEVATARNVTGRKKIHVFFMDYNNLLGTAQLAQRGITNVMVHLEGSGAVDDPWSFPYHREYDINNHVKVKVSFHYNTTAAPAIVANALHFIKIYVVIQEDAPAVAVQSQRDNLINYYTAWGGHKANLESAGIKDFNVDTIKLRGQRP